MGHSNLIFVIGIGLAIAGLTIGAAINMRRNAEGPEVASEYRVAREIAVSGLHLAKAELADDYDLWFNGFTLTRPYEGGQFTATVTPVDTGWVEIRSTGTFGRGEYLVIGEFIVELADYDFGEKDKVTICHITGACNNWGLTISISWSAWEGPTGHQLHSLVCPGQAVDGGDTTYTDSLGPCGAAAEWQNVNGVSLVEYSEWRIQH